jgi:hypothetical protein
MQGSSHPPKSDSLFQVLHEPFEYSMTALAYSLALKNLLPETLQASASAVGC